MKWSEFEQVLEGLMKEENIAGAAVAVSQNGKTIYSKGFGVRNIETKEPVTPSTIFGIASVTKSFTALAIMHLEEQGKLSGDDPVIRYLPEFSLPGAKDMSKISIRHLLSHTTGLPPMDRRQHLDKLNQHLEYLAEAEVEMLGEPGEYFSYCNDTFLLLGAIIERLTGMLYRRYITRFILDYLGMDRSTFSLEEVAKFDDVSTPYNYDLKEKRLEEQKWPVLGNYEVGGGVRSNVLDLLKYGNQFVGGKSVVSPKGLNKMWQPVHQIRQDMYYCYGLQVTHNYHGISLVEHGGGQPGVSSMLGFVPERGVVVAVLTNVGGVPAGEIWLKAVNTALGLPIESKRPTPSDYPATPEELQRFIGLYKSDEGGKLEITLEDDVAVAKAGEQEFELRVSSPESLVLSKRELPLQFFFAEGQAKPWAVFFGSRILRRVE